MEIYKTKLNMSDKYKYYLDSDKCVIADLSKCMEDKNMMLSEVKKLCDNVTSLNLDEIKKYALESLDNIDNKNYLCLKHIGKYIDRYKTYDKLLDEIKSKDYIICGLPIEQYIKGSWNELDENKYETNIMIPIENRS